MGIRQTTPSKFIGVIRILMGFLFLMTGFMKLLVPLLQGAFAGQLKAAGIPFVEINQWLVPILEVLIGVFLLFGLLARLGATVVVVLMLVATYVHLVVQDPNLFPLQPRQPVVPLFLIVMAVLIIFRGGGAWSMDLGKR